MEVHACTCSATARRQGLHGYGAHRAGLSYTQRLLKDTFLLAFAYMVSGAEYRGPWKWFGKNT